MKFLELRVASCVSGLVFLMSWAPGIAKTAMWLEQCAKSWARHLRAVSSSKSPPSEWFLHAKTPSWV